MSSDRSADILEKFFEYVREREQQRPREERLERKGRVRNKYRLLNKWQVALDEYSGPGSAKLVDEYRPSGCQAPVDVSEIAGLIVWDSEGRAHHLRLYRDETAAFIEIPDDPNSAITIDPMVNPRRNAIYDIDGPPQAVVGRLDAMEVVPRWRDACDGQHDFAMTNEGTRFEAIQCQQCGHTRHVLSWLGHTVPHS